MKADEPTQLETNELAQRLTGLAEKAKTGQLLNVRLIALIALVVTVLVVWFYLRTRTQDADTKTWKSLELMSGTESLESFSKEHPNSTHGKVAKLQLARTLLGPNGISNLRRFDGRKKAIENIERARELFTQLITDFSGDVTLKAQSIEGAAQAELALVGIPKDGTSGDDRGSVEKTAELYTQFAKLVGEQTKLGEEAAKHAKELLEKKSAIIEVAKNLNTQLTPIAPAPEIQAPPSLAPIAPIGVVPDAPATPTTPIVPPTISPTTARTPAPPPPAATKK